MSPHYLENHHAIVTFGSRVKLVDRFDRRADRCIKAEGRNRTAHIVVDRLGNTDDLEPLLDELQSDSKRAVPTDRNQRIDACTLNICDDLVRAVARRITAIGLQDWKSERIPPVGRAQDSAAEVRDAADR